MTVFVDTSALYALFDRDDAAHRPVAKRWSTLLDAPRPLVTTNYVLVETTALLQRRLGMAAVRDFNDAVLPILTLHWVDETLHWRGVSRQRRADRRGLSFVDCISFEVMEERGIRDALAVDDDFKNEGFRLL